MTPEGLAIVSLIANVVLGIIAALMKRLVDANEKRIDENERRLNDQQKELSMVRESMPQHYIRRDDFRDWGDNIFSTLRRIEDKLDKKVDKP